MPPVSLCIGTYRPSVARMIRRVIKSSKGSNVDVVFHGRRPKKGTALRHWYNVPLRSARRYAVYVQYGKRARKIAEQHSQELEQRYSRNLQTFAMATSPQNSPDGSNQVQQNQN